MARQKEFERDEALGRAMRLFWMQGYAATSTEALLKTMGISRQSMYDTFGDKRTLYLEALQRYVADSVGTLLRDLHATDTPLDGIERALVSFASNAAREPGPGCLGINAICEFGQTDTDLNALTETSERTLKRAFGNLLDNAKERGDIAADVDVRVATQFLISTLAGMKVSAKGGADARTLGDIARFALRSMAPVSCSKPRGKK